MTRKECLDYIKKNKLSEKATVITRNYTCNPKTNYTNAPTELLIRIIEDHQELIAKKQKVKDIELDDSDTAMLDRNACFTLIKDNNWQDEVKAQFGKTYNSVKTEDLITFIRNRSAKKSTKINKLPSIDGKADALLNQIVKVLKAVCILLNNKELAETL